MYIKCFPRTLSPRLSNGPSSPPLARPGKNKNKLPPRTQSGSCRAVGRHGVQLLLVPRLPEVLHDLLSRGRHPGHESLRESSIQGTDLCPQQDGGWVEELVGWVDIFASLEENKVGCDGWGGRVEGEEGAAIGQGVLVEEGGGGEGLLRELEILVVPLGVGIRPRNLLLRESSGSGALVPLSEPNAPGRSLRR